MPKPGDHTRALTMMLIATSGGHLIRVPLNRNVVETLISMGRTQEEKENAETS